MTTSQNKKQQYSINEKSLLEDRIVNAIWPRESDDKDIAAIRDRADETVGDYYTLYYNGSHHRGRGNHTDFSAQRDAAHVMIGALERLAEVDNSPSDTSPFSIAEIVAQAKAELAPLLLKRADKHRAVAQAAAAEKPVKDLLAELRDYLAKSSGNDDVATLKQAALGKIDAYETILAERRPGGAALLQKESESLLAALADVHHMDTGFGALYHDAQAHFTAQQAVSASHGRS